MFWGEIFDRAELVMDNAVEDGDPTSSSQLDLLVMNLAGSFRLGYWGSRADDVILRLTPPAGKCRTAAR